MVFISVKISFGLAVVFINEPLHVAVKYNVRDKIYSRINPEP